MTVDRALELAGHRVGGQRLERAIAGGGEIARDAVHAEAIAAVGRDRDVDHRIADAENGGCRLADPGIGRQFDDAVVILAEAQLARRAQHAGAFDAADDALLEIDAGTGDMRAGGREHALHAGVRVGRTAHDLDLVRAGVDDADAQPVGIGMLVGRNHMADDEGRETLRAVLDAFDLEAERGQALHDVVERAIGIEMVLEPGEGEFHRAPPLGRARLGMSSDANP